MPDRRLNGLNPLAYMGVNPSTPSNFVVNTIDPTQNDWQNFELFDWWLNSTTQAIWVLTSLSGNIATWVKIASSAGNTETLTGNTGGAVGPDGSQNINVVGDGVTITIAGSPGTNTLTASVIGGGVGASTFHTDAGDATQAGGAITIAGTTNIGTSGAGSTVTIALKGTTNHSVQVGNASGNLTSVAVGATNTVLLGNTGADPSFGAVPNAALANSSITLSNGNNITVTGSPVSLGGTATIAVTGTTNHAVQVGNGTGSLTSVAVGATNTVLLGNTGADPSFGTVPNGALTNSSVTLTAGTGISIVGGGPLSLGGTATISATAATPLSFPTDSGTATPAANVLNVLGGTAGRDINTSGSGATVHIDLKNAITLGDLSAIAANSGAVTCTTGDVIITAGDLTLPNTNSSANQGIIKFGGNATIHNYGASGGGTTNLFLGKTAGNFTLTPGTATGNYGLGDGTLNGLTTGEGNIAIASSALTSCTTGNFNTAFGTSTLGAVTTGSLNTGFGHDALLHITTGSSNTAVGQTAGQNYTSSESSNVVIANAGVVSESNVIRIGTQGALSGQQNKCWIAGIRGVTTGVADAVAVLVDSTGQLGTVSSTRRVKDNIKDIEEESERIFDLRPVSFNFKNQQVKSYGLIAEEVAETLPELAVLENGEPMSVKYHELPVLLLNELQKLRSRLNILEAHRCLCKK